MDRPTKVTSVFHSRKTLDAAAQNLLVAGSDRADIDVSASVDELQRGLNYKSIPAADIAYHPAAARQPFVGKDDVVNTDAVVVASPAALSQSLWRFISSLAAPHRSLLASSSV